MGNTKCLDVAHAYVFVIVRNVSDLQKEDDAGVGHSISQTQNPTAHDSIAEIEDGHAKRGLSFKLAK